MTDDAQLENLARAANKRARRSLFLKVVLPAAGVGLFVSYVLNLYSSAPQTTPQEACEAAKHTISQLGLTLEGCYCGPDTDTHLHHICHLRIEGEEVSRWSCTGPSCVKQIH